MEALYFHVSEKGHLKVMEYFCQGSIVLFPKLAWEGLARVDDREEEKAYRAERREMVQCPGHF